MFSALKNTLFFLLILINERANAHRQNKCLTNESASKDLMVQYLVAMNDSLSYFKTASSSVVLQSPMVAMNALYGLFLMKVNLKHVITHNQLSWDIRDYFMMLIEKNAEVAALYRSMVEVEDSKAKRIAPITDNEDIWVKNIKKFSLNKRFNPHRVQQFEERWPDTCMYILHVWKYIDVNDIKFDDCYIDIVERRNRIPYDCDMKLDCVRAAVAGGDLGYLLAHRIILFTLVAYDGQCSMTSYDNKAITALCEQAFAEGVYIGNHWYEFADLLFEFISICSLNGHSEFIQEAWFSILLTMQEPSGQFIIKKSVDYQKCENKAGLVYEEPVHFDAVAIAALAAASRLTVENICEE